MKYKVSHIIEYAIIRALAGFIRILPLRVALSLAWPIAAATHFIGRINVARTRTRIREVFGDRFNDKEVAHIAWIAWRNLFFNGIEAMRSDQLTIETIRKHPMAALEPKLKAIHAEHANGFVLATPHMGNWEMAAIAGDLIGLPLFTIVRKQRNPLINDYINQMRRVFNLELIYREVRMFKGVVDRIKNGKVLAILPDINVRTKGITVNYLNNPAHIAPGAAQFAQLANCPIYALVARRIGWTQHDATLFGPIILDPTADKKADQQRIMQEIMDFFTKEISKTPEQYFWYNKRWVLKKRD